MPSDESKKRSDRDARAAVLHYLRGNHTFTDDLIQEYSPGAGHELYFGFLRLAANFVGVLTAERDASVDDIFRTLPVEAGDKQAAEVTRLMVSGAPTETFIAALVKAGGVNPQFCFNLIRVNIAILDAISALGGKPKHGVDGSPESWLQQYLYWIANDLPPDEGYTYHRDDPQPCCVCGDSAFGRDPQGRPHHVWCGPGGESAG